MRARASPPRARLVARIFDQWAEAAALFFCFWGKCQRWLADFEVCKGIASHVVRHVSVALLRWPVLEVEAVRWAAEGWLESCCGLGETVRMGGGAGF